MFIQKKKKKTEEDKNRNGKYRNRNRKKNIQRSRRITKETMATHMSRGVWKSMD